MMLTTRVRVVVNYAWHLKNKNKKKGQNTMPIHIPVKYTDVAQVVTVRIK